MRFSTWTVGASLAWLSTASPIVPRQDDAQHPSPCAAIESLVQAANATSPDFTTPTIPAEAAWNCLQSVPLNTSAALDLIRSIKPFLRWQSTTAYIENPPQEYVDLIQKPVQFWAGIDDIESNLHSGKWTKEYDFGFALYKLLQSTHDGHFTYFPDVIFKVFTWGRPTPLVSVSEDGHKLPSIFVYSDILAASAGASFEPSAVTKINGDDVLDFLYEFSQVGSLQDRDALWNNMFYELAQVSLGTSGSGTGTFSGGGRGRVIYPGPTTEFEFSNGTTTEVENYARVLVDFAGVTSGEDLYKKFFAYPDTTFDLSGPPPDAQSTSTSTSTATAPAAATATPAPGYPAPVIRESHNLIGGYYLDDPAYADVAVLSVPSFVGIDDAEIDFQATGEKFLAAAKAAGKSKLIVDVSANAGGTILQGYDLFKQLFPTIDPYGAADRLRAHEALDIIGKVFSDVSGKYPRTLDQDYAIVDLESSPMNYRSDLLPVPETSEHFTSWEQKYGPEEYNGDEFTSRFKWWLSDPLVTWNSAGIEITGYGNRSNPPPQPFAAENVVIVYDGYCASTCTIFSELMRQLAGVKTVAMGGRPNADIIQAVGGVKGTNNFPWDYIQSLVETSFNFSTPEQKESYKGTELADYNNYLWSLRAVGGPNINARDGIRKGDKTNTPLHFVYEEADCRLFYEPSMTVDVTSLWRAVADVKWTGKRNCVAGSLNGKDSAASKGHVKREVSGKATVKRVGSKQLGALRESLLLETDTWTGRIGDGVMVP
jgi:hypothetical protein